MLRGTGTNRLHGDRFERIGRTRNEKWFISFNGDELSRDNKTRWQKEIR